MSNTAPPTSTRSPQAQAAIDIIANRFATREQARSAELDALEAGATPEEAVRAFVDVMHGASPPAQRVYMEQAFEMLDVSPESFLALLQAQVRAEDEKVMTATNTIQNALQSSRELSERMQALQVLHQRVSQDSDQSVDLQDGDITVNGRQMCLGQAVIEFDLVDELNLTRHVDGDPLWYRGVALRADAIQSAIDGLRQKQQSVTSSNELNMINMQQAMQQRGQHIQLVSKVLAMMGDTERAIVGEHAMTSGLTAVAHLADLLRLPRAQRDAVFALGERELANGQTEQAIETLQIAAQLDPLNPTRFRRLGDALRAGGRVAEADLYTQFAQELAR